MFWFNQTIIIEPAVCATLKLQYWCQLKYYVIKLFGRVAACVSCAVQNETLQSHSALRMIHTQNRTALTFWNRSFTFKF
jgi:ribosomal protein S26